VQLIFLILIIEKKIIAKFLRVLPGGRTFASV